MKIILSRKGFDSSAGKQASPIMPDGTLLSLPIPDEEDTNMFSSLQWKDKSYYDIISSFRPRFKEKLQKETAELATSFWSNERSTFSFT